MSAVIPTDRYNFERFDPLQLEPAVLAVERAKLSVAEKTKLWVAAIEDAKRCVANLHKHRANIVKLCLKSCDIHRGGGHHWSNHNGVFTARRFAEEIGVEYKTLMNWIRCWRDIVGELQAGEWKDDHYKYAQQTVKSLGQDATPKERVAAFRKLRDSHVPVTHPRTGKEKVVEKGHAYKLTSTLHWMKSHKAFLSKTPARELDQELLQQIRDVLKETLAVVSDKLG